MEFSRPEYWSGEPFLSLEGLPNPGIEPRSPALQADSLPAEPQGSTIPDNIKVTCPKSYCRLAEESEFEAKFGLLINYKLSFPGGSHGKESACNAGDLGSIPGLGKSPGEGSGYPLLHSCLENSTDREAW